MDSRYSAAVMFIRFFLLCFFYATVSAHHDYRVVLTSNQPVVLGAAITFRAEVFKDDVKQGGRFKFKWVDNMNPQNKHEETHQGVSTWKIQHSTKIYQPGTYEVRVAVYADDEIIDWWLCFASRDFTLTASLNGELILQPNYTEAPTTYINSKDNILHFIKLNGPDNEYLKTNTANGTISWFIDGILNNTSTSLELSWNHTYPVADVSHTISVIILADRKDQIDSSSSLNSTTEVDIVDSTNSSASTKFINATDPSSKENSSNSTSNITTTTTVYSPKPPKGNQVNGTFSTKITVKAPIENLNIVGSGWLQHGEMLNLRITCNGSGPFKFCRRFYTGDYKVIGNETCKYPPETRIDCDYSVDHYFSDSQIYTVLLIVSNDVSKNITAVGVNIYEVTKHPQLSVVVVPLMASILAIILIIFGVAFYFQNRSSYAIEVADFDFTNNNDLEYKTFKERLAEAIHNAFNQPEDFSEEDSYNGVPSTSNKKYGSMQ